ncbi:hypothetical protein EMPG_12492 [Blastomyces silverae]|uniref:Uncharacterized protein n=1 Tax=Blastomyces silverae TaxID=2060906 RepID=A0A0H1BN86_9EURO|nr:hypothetical protein EMPG_12492 [Blastomyces silverae]
MFKNCNDCQTLNYKYICDAKHCYLTAMTAAAVTASAADDLIITESDVDISELIINLSESAINLSQSTVNSSTTYSYQFIHCDFCFYICHCQSVDFS